MNNLTDDARPTKATEQATPEHQTACVKMDERQWWRSSGLGGRRRPAITPAA